MIHVIHISNDFYPLTGGIATYLFNLLPEISGLGIKTSLVVPVESDSEKLVIEDKSGDPFIVRVHYRRTANLFFRFYRLTKAVEKGVEYVLEMCGDADIIHQHDTRATKFGAWRAGKKNHIPTIWTNHNSGFFSNSFFLTRSFFSISYFMPAGIIYVHKHMVKLFKSSSYKQAELQHISNGVDIDIFKNDGNVSERKKIIVLFPQRIHRKKDPVTFARAIKEAIDKRPGCQWQILIAGSNFQSNTEAGLIKQIYKILEDPVKKGICKFLGDVPYKKMAEYYKKSDIVIATSLTETESIVVFEGWASGNAVITSKQFELNGYAIDGENCLLVEHHNPGALAAAIINLAENKELRNKLAKNGHKIVKERFTWKRTAEKTVKFYSQILK